MQIIKDASKNHWVYRILPKFLIPYAQLMRLDRPVGNYLLLWPCIISMVLALLTEPEVRIWQFRNLYYFILFFIGAVVMRSAGCAINDIIDIDIDKKVQRTKLRPLASGKISLLAAWLVLGLLLLLGLAVLLQFNWITVKIGISSVALIFFYPLAKRLFSYPQFVLGMVFNWGFLLGWTAITGKLDMAAIFLYLGGIFWTVGFDTIYAFQDIEDDKLIGIGSTALKIADKTYFLYIFYGLFLVFFSLAIYSAKIAAIYYLASLGVGLHLLWQLKSFDRRNPQSCLRIFKSNGYLGFFIVLLLLILYSISSV